MGRTSQWSFHPSTPAIAVVVWSMWISSRAPTLESPLRCLRNLSKRCGRAPPKSLAPSQVTALPIARHCPRFSRLYLHFSLLTDFVSVASYNRSTLKDMKFHNQSLSISPTDLSYFLSCRHRAARELSVAHGARKRPVWDNPVLETLIELGQRHEARYVQRLKESGKSVLDLSDVMNIPIAHWRMVFPYGRSNQILLRRKRVSRVSKSTQLTEVVIKFLEMFVRHIQNRLIHEGIQVNVLGRHEVHPFKQIDCGRVT